jgi:hypothetical protein
MAKNTQEDGKKSRRQSETERYVFENWPGLRSMGKGKYIIRHGFLTWGVSTFTVYWILVAIMNRVSEVKTPLTVLNFAFTFFMFAIFGMVYGELIWRRNERIYKRKYPYVKKNK